MVKHSFFKLFLAALAIFLAIGFTVNAKVFIVDNYKFVEQYTSLDCAINDSGDGDTIYISGSPHPYPIRSDHRINNRTFIGIGYNPQTPTDFSSIIVGNDSCIFNFWNGVTSSSINKIPDYLFSNDSNLTFEGINFIANNGNSNWYNMNNIKFIRCYFSTGTYNFSARPWNYPGGLQNVESSSLEFFNCIFEHCKISGGDIGSSDYNAMGSNTFNSFIFNCIFWYSDILYFSGNEIDNNVFIGCYNGSVLNHISHSVFNNNMFNGAPDSSFGNDSYCRFNNNLFTNTVTLPPDGERNSSMNNQNGQSSGFTKLISGTAWSYSNDFHLQTGSAGKNNGTDGRDIGIFGGPMPFPQIADGTTDYTGEPAELPVIRSLNYMNSGGFPVVGKDGQVQFQVRAIKK